MNYNKICIIGTGLIGASLSLAFKRKGIGNEIIGVDKPDIIEKAKDSGIIDRGYSISHLEKGIADAELIILATPIHKIMELISPIADLASPGALVTDVGSSKEQLIKVIASQYIGIKKNISLVEIPGSILVVGVSNENISLLTKIEDKVVLDVLQQKNFRFTPSFSDHLQRLTDRFRPAKSKE